MDDQTIVQKVNQVFLDEFEIEEEKLRPEAHIRNDLGLDSLDIVDLVVVLEKSFQFKMPDKQVVAQIETLGDIYKYLMSIRDKEIGLTK